MNDLKLVVNGLINIKNYSLKEPLNMLKNNFLVNARIKVVK